MNVGMMQPLTMPWLGLFELIYTSDVFVFLDDFQFSSQSWGQRNRFFINKGQVGWYTIPVVKSVSFLSAYNEVKINETIPWRIKMMKRIQQNYSRATYYQIIFPFISDWLSMEKNSLAAQNMAFIKSACDLMGFKREFRLSSAYPSKDRRSKRVLQLLRASGATRYYCARGSFDYMFEDGLFPVSNIETLFQNFCHSPYRQVGSPDSFIPYLPILD